MSKTVVMVLNVSIPNGKGKVNNTVENWLKSNLVSIPNGKGKAKIQTLKELKSELYQFPMGKVKDYYTSRGFS